MSKETIKMKSIRITRIGIKEVLNMAEQAANDNRIIIAANWDKEDNAECRKALYKAHRSLAKYRAVIRECQAQLRATKRELRKLNRQHDMRVKGMSASERAAK
jgi:uncharacterized coiled-coil DUF342 family protein